MTRSARESSVLVIEDDDDIRELLISHVRSGGWSAEGEASGSEGIAAAQRESPTAVVVDLLLPDMDGRQVIRALRADPRTAECRIVLNSVLDLEDYLHTVVDLGVSAVLPKPFTRRDVTELLESLAEDPT